MELEYEEDASGPCIVCGKDSRGSFYWLPLPEAQWDILRPLVTHLFRPDMVQNTLFFPGLSRPFCGPECVQEYHKKVAADHCKRGG